jgi:hypothetical protein
MLCAMDCLINSDWAKHVFNIYKIVINNSQIIKTVHCSLTAIFAQPLRFGIFMQRVQ